jgi:uncharacterized protein YjiS (DUF1127 family)
MTAQFTKTNLTFELPRQTYINARLEEPNLFAEPATPARQGVFAWIAERVAAFASWKRRATEAAELHGMTDRELADIGVNRGDIGRLFAASHARDLREARALLS